MSTPESERIKILIAEDSVTTRTALSGMLNSWDYDVCEVADGAQAWQEFDKEVYRIVLTDWQMPDVDGLELIRRIRAKENTGFVYTILLTARSATSDVVSAMADGADAYLIKPAEPEELRARIRAGVRIVKLERKLERRRQELLDVRTRILEAEKLAGIGQLAAGMAHEVNNPIAVVSGNIDVFARGIQSLLEILDSWEAVREETQIPTEVLQRIDDISQRNDLSWLRESLPRYLHTTNTNVQRVRDIISRLQDFSWHDKAQIDRIDPVQAVETTIAVLGSELARAHVTVERSFQPVSSFTCHPPEFNQAVYNVLHNAIQASSPGDKVDIGIQESDGTLTILVADRGPGIPEQDRSRIFQPFFTTRRVGAGSGLGLSYSHRVIRESGGSISCSPRTGGGTVFEISIPVSSQSTAAE